MSQLIHKKMSEVMKEVGHIAKAQTNTQQGFKFRGIDQFVNALYPALTKHGVFMSPRATLFTQELKEVVRSSGKAGVDKHVAIMMEYDFWAEDGSKVTVGPIPAEGLDSGDKATNKALSAALKYALIQTFSIPTVDMAEADLESPELGSSKNITKNKSTPITLTVHENGSTSQTLTVPIGEKGATLESTTTTSTAPTLVGQAANTPLPETKKSSGFRKKPVTSAPTTQTSSDSEWN